jgi:hypothetical protein
VCKEGRQRRYNRCLGWGRKVHTGSTIGSDGWLLNSIALHNAFLAGLSTGKVRVVARRRPDEFLDAAPDRSPTESPDNRTIFFRLSFVLTRSSKSQEKEVHGIILHEFHLGRIFESLAV